MITDQGRIMLREGMIGQQHGDLDLTAINPFNSKGYVDQNWKMDITDRLLSGVAAMTPKKAVTA